MAAELLLHAQLDGQPHPADELTAGVDRAVRVYPFDPHLRMAQRRVREIIRDLAVKQ